MAEGKKGDASRDQYRYHGGPTLHHGSILTRPDREPYWAWRETESQIWLGGPVDSPAPDVGGPYLAEPMTLRVIAFAPDGVVFGASQPVEVAS